MLLIHQIPPTPAYLRVKIGRHLARVGAVAIKSSVYALPFDDETQEDLQWVLREIVKGGGDASIVEARFVEGLTDAQVIELFQRAREADYRALAEEVRAALAAFTPGGPPRRSASSPRDRGSPRGGLPDDRRPELVRQVARLRQRATELTAIDFFGAPGREVVEGLLSAMEERMRTPSRTSRR